MADLVPAVGELSYHGYTFGPKTRTEISGKAVWDAAQRTIIYIVYTIIVRTIITDDADTGTTIENIRKKLQSPGGQLKVTDMGFGNFQINVNGTKDVVWGPKPQVLRWKSIGSKRACEVNWQVEVAIPECDAAQYRNAIMEYATRYSWDIDESGYTTRTCTGYIRIPQTRASQSTRSLQDNADSYRSRIVASFPEGFRRTVSNFTLDESKCRLDFTFTDVEMPPTALPEGVIKASVEHSIQSNPPLGSQWTGVISGSYEMAKDQPVSKAFYHFIRAATDRASKASFSTFPQSLIITAFGMREPDIYGRSLAAFTLSYTFLASLKNILQASGLWSPISGADFNLWRTSMTSGILSSEARGFAGLKFENSGDVIVDLCQSPSLNQPIGGKITTRSEGEQHVLRNKYPHSEQSWLDYKLHAELKTDDNVVVMKTLPQQQRRLRSGDLSGLTNPSEGNSAGSEIEHKVGGSLVNNSTDGYKTPYQQEQGTTSTQSRSDPNVWLYLTGSALRAGYLVTPPKVDRVAGASVEPCNNPDECYFKQAKVADLYGVPVVAAKWRQKYIFTEPLEGTVGVPTNPLIA